MTEKEFDQKIENMASQLEQKIETAAEHLDKGITQKYKQNRLFRFAAQWYLDNNFNLISVGSNKKFIYNT